MLTEFSVSTPAHLSKEQKSIFFKRIKKEWAEAKKQKIKQGPTKGKSENETDVFKEKTLQQGQKGTETIIRKNSPGPTFYTEQPTQIILSKPNEEQTNDLRILFEPNDYFKQDEMYRYPVVKMPKHKSSLKLPRNGRSNQKGYKEEALFILIKSEIKELIISDNFHMVIPFYNKPYEPDIVIFDKKRNLYIDIEIDEPYDGYYRYATHNYRAKDTFKQDNIRDLFFTESGWIVIRFTERQIELQPYECLRYIRQVINSICKNSLAQNINIEYEEQWNENQSIQWQKNKYRENYLGIHSFQKRNNKIDVSVSVEENESIEEIIIRTESIKNDNGFDDELHKYFHKNDKTGNAEYLSVTTLVERFFQFDILRYIQREAEKQDRDVEELVREFQTSRSEAADLGTELHLQIEKYFKKQLFDDSLQEFKYFLNFEKEKIIPKGLTFAYAELKIFCSKFNVAGTVDCLFQDTEDNYVMVDWKRSKKLIVNGTNQPDKRGFQIEIEGLTNLTNSSYYRYCIQQNLYKYILEQEHKIKISEMILVVLHENYPRYHTIKLPEMVDETELIFTSINHKI